MKTLVIENVSYLDNNIIHYLNQNDIDYDVIYNAEYKQEEIFNSISKYKRLVLSSTFNNIEQVEKILTLLVNTNYIKQIDLLYLFEKPGRTEFINLINEWSDNIKTLIKTLLEKCVINQIIENSYEVVTKKSYFKKFKYYFDTVPIYFNNKFNVFYYTRLPQIGLLNSELLINETKNENKFIIKEEHKSDFNNMIDELRAMLIYQKDICEDANNIERVKENEKWIELFDLYFNRLKY